MSSCNFTICLFGTSIVHAESSFFNRFLAENQKMLKVYQFYGSVNFWEKHSRLTLYNQTTAFLLPCSTCFVRREAVVFIVILSSIRVSNSGPGQWSSAETVRRLCSHIHLVWQPQWLRLPTAKGFFLLCCLFLLLPHDGPPFFECVVEGDS